MDEDGRVLSMGHNGAPKGRPHCLDKPCQAAEAPSGMNLDLCEAVHAEQNALLFCPNVMSIQTCYVTASPCLHCVKMLLQTSCSRIVFAEPYALEDVSRAMWLGPGEIIETHLDALKIALINVKRPSWTEHCRTWERLK